MSGHISITFAMEIQAQLSETPAQHQYIIQQMHSVMHYLWHISTATCCSSEVPSSGSHYNKSV